MPVVEKYRCDRLVGWSDEAEVHSGPPDPAHGGVPIAVKIRHGLPGPPRPDGNRGRFLKAAQDQAAAVVAGCRGVAPVFETGKEGNNAFYVSKRYPRSAESLIQGRVSLDSAALHRLTDRTLRALEELRDKNKRAHGNLKPSNVFFEGKNVGGSAVVLGDLAPREQGRNQGADCHALGAMLYQLVRGRAVRNFDWPMVHGPDWEPLGPAADGWREFCNVLMAPDTQAQPDTALVTARRALRGMRRLAAQSRRVARARGEAVYRPAQKGRGFFAGIGAAITAAVGAVALTVQPPNSKAKNYLRALPVVGMYAGRLFPLPTPEPTPEATPLLAQITPPPVMETPEPTPEDTPTPAPTATPVPTATPPPTPNYIGYAALLGRFKQRVDSPEMVDSPENLNGYLKTFKEDIGFQTVAGEAGVQAFLRALPATIPTTGSQPDLPSDRWVKDGAARVEDVQTVTYHWVTNPAVKMQFNKVVAPNVPPFYLSAAAVPLQLGALLAKVAETDGKGPLSGASSPKGPVSWQYVGGQYGRRASWMVLDSVNQALYADKGAPTEESPMNGLSGIDAGRLARAAGCVLPTVAQWGAVLSTASGQQWTSRWQAEAKVRGPQWTRFAKEAQARSVANTGTRLPNDQCFGDRANLDPVGTNADANLFFEPVGQRVIGGFAQLIGNVGQYVVDNAQTPTRYFFAGGSAESAPAVFASLTAPPAVPTAFIAVADGGLRLATGSKGNGSEKNPALDKLKVDLNAEIARAQKL